MAKITIDYGGATATVTVFTGLPYAVARSIEHLLKAVEKDHHLVHSEEEDRHNV